MIGRRSTIGLALLCAFAFSALVAQSAMAQVGDHAVNTTAVTCVEDPGNGDFDDPHCDVLSDPAGTGDYSHVAISNNQTTEITVNNETTGGVTDPAILKGVLAGVNTEISCKTVHGEGTIHNIETSGKHTVTGELTTKFGGAAGSGDCTVVKPANCKLKEPIEVKSEFVGVEGLGPSNDTMGVEQKPAGGAKAFVELTFENNPSKCSLLNGGKAFPVEGSAIATGKPNPKEDHSGATAIFEGGNEMETLEIGLKKQEFSLNSTIRMKDGGPIALTTTT